MRGVSLKLIFSYLEPRYDKTFIHHVYSCRKGKGVHVAVNDVDAALRKISKNYTRIVWSLKLDIQKFFASVDHNILFFLLKKKIRDADMLDFLRIIIDSFFTPGCNGKGMPIGNLTSQIFANIYLSELDYFAKHALHEKYYFRYADDFLFLHTDRNRLLQIQTVAEAFVQNVLKLTVHPKKIIIRPYHHGIDWLGYILRPHYRTIRTKTKQRILKKIRRRGEDFKAGLCSEESFRQTVQSYFGVLKHCNAHRLYQQILNDVWLYWWEHL
jgi:retron-type reverse transcriptase